MTTKASTGGKVSVTVSPVTPANLRKFAQILFDMAERLERESAL